MTLKELLEKRAQEKKDKIFLYFEEQQISYEQFDKTINKVANALSEAGIGYEDKVCIHLTNCPEFLYTWFACFKIAAISVPINPQLKSEEIEYILNNSDSKVMVTENSLIDRVLAIKDKCPQLIKIVVVGGEDKDNIVSFPTFIKDAADTAPSVEVKEDDIACIIYTSGTTGKPKGCMLTHGNYYQDVKAAVAGLGMTEDDRFMCILPLFHVNGQVATTLSPLLAGASMVLQRRFSASNFLEWIDKYKPTAFSAVPTIYAILLNQPGAEKYDLSSLRFCICGAAPMPVEVFNKFEEKFKAKILEGYGLSEGTCVSSLNPIGGTRKVGSIGLPLSVNEMKIVDDQGQELPLKQIGEIIIKGPNVMREYYKNEQATKEILKDGWLHSGDLGYVDEDGFFYIVGRKKEMIIRGGENIYPREIEEVLYKHPKILEAAVVGVSHPVYGEEVKAYIVPKEGETLTKEEVIAYCKEKLADYKCPKLVEFRTSLPKTATGKIQKHEIK